MSKIYEKHTNGCSPYSINYFDDKIEIIFDFIPKNEPYKKFTIYAYIDEWDWNAFIDFSVIDLYVDRIINKASTNSLKIYKVEWMWIILEIGKEKILFPAYHNYIYYTSDFNLVIEYQEYKNWEVINEEKKVIDLQNLNIF